LLFMESPLVLCYQRWRGLKEWVNCTKLDAIHDHGSQDCARDKETTLIKAIAQTLHISIDLAFLTTLIAQFDREDLHQALFKQREDDQGKHGFKQHLNAINGDVVMFLIKAAGNDEACPQAKSTIREADREIFLNQQAIECQFTNEGVVLHRETNDNQHIKPKHQENDQGVLGFHHDSAGEVGDYDGMAETDESIAHVLTLQDLIGVIEVVKDDRFHNVEREKIENNRDRSPHREVEKAQKESGRLVKGNR
jgi:hypothetical protein